MSLRPPQFLVLFLVVVIGPLALTTNGDSSFKGNRRPGILESATEEPTGENALLYRHVGKLKPDELLDLVSETPTGPGSNRLTKRRRR